MLDGKCKSIGVSVKPITELTIVTLKYEPRVQGKGKLVLLFIRTDSSLL